MTQKRVLLGAGLIAAGLLARRAAAKRYSFTGKSVLITGGSRGLGLVMARRLAAEGARLTLVARDSAELQMAAQDLCARGAEVFVVTADVTKRENADGAVAQTIAHYGTIDVLINNAGIIQSGPIEDMKAEDFEEAMAVHGWGPLYTMLAAVPHMRQRGTGRIVNVSSIGGKVAVPHLAPYVMSKFALAGLSDALRAELRKDGIYVTTVIPGLMRTGSHVNARFKGQHQAEFALFSAMAGNPLLSISAERAAGQILEACRRGRAELVITIQARLAVIVNSLFPNLTAELAAFTARFLPGTVTGSWASEEKTGRESASAWSPSLLTRLADKAVSRNNENLQQPIG